MWFSQNLIIILYQEIQDIYHRGNWTTFDFFPFVMFGSYLVVDDIVTKIKMRKIIFRSRITNQLIVFSLLNQASNLSKFRYKYLKNHWNKF